MALLKTRNGLMSSKVPQLSSLRYAFVVMLLCFFCSPALHQANESAEPVETYDKYYNYKALTRMLKRLVWRHPSIVSLSSIGRSVEGRELWVVRITTHPITETPGKPRFKFVGNVHGNEALSRQMLAYLVEYLLTGYGVDPRITDLVNRTDIYIMPSMNPDGFERAQEGECQGKGEGRENAKHKDLHRSFPDQFDNTDVPGSDVPEVFAVIKWIRQKKFILSGNLNGGSVVASYPFDNPPSHPLDGVYNRSADDTLFRFLAWSYMEHNPTMNPGKPQCPQKPTEGFKDGITKGAEWYDVKGGMQDYNYLQGECMEVTMALSCCKYPPASQLSTEWENNREALLSYMEKVHIGVKGYVMAARSGMALPGSRITVEGLDHNVTTWKFGDYYRLLMPGSYIITASSPGYAPLTVRMVQVAEGRATELNFTMEELGKEIPPLPTPTTTILTPSPSSTATVSIEATVTPISVTIETMVTPLTPTPNAVTMSTSIETPMFPLRPAPETQPEHVPIQPWEFRHHGYSDMELFLRHMSAEYPAITQLYSIGQSAQGRQLYVMEITADPGVHETNTIEMGKPALMLVGNVHGNEVVGRELLLSLLDYLCLNYGDDPEVTWLVNKTQIHILPSMNPDGYEVAREGDVTSSEGHNNSRNVDLNTNFPNHSTPGLSLQPETVAMVNWMKSRPFALSVGLYGGSLKITYPHSEDSVLDYDSPDDAVFKMVAQAYFNTNLLMMQGPLCDYSDPMAFSVEDTTVGGTAQGVSMQDWAYLHTSALQMSVYVGCVNYPLAEELHNYWEDNQNGLLGLIREVHVGVRGRVIDIHSLPITNASVTVEGAEHVVCTDRTGEFWRLLTPGRYQLSASANGYSSVTVSALVLAGEMEQVEFRLPGEQRKSLLDSDEEEFGRLIKELSTGRGMERLIHGMALPVGIRYNSYRERAEYLMGLTVNYPNITHLRSLGQSVEFRTIWALEISDSPSVPEPSEPKVRFVAGIHGNAPVGTELLLELAAFLCINYGQNPIVTKLIDRTRVVIVPCVNPDGREQAQRGECSSRAGLTNAQQTDLDQNFIYGGNRSGSSAVDPETRALMGLIQEGGFTLSVSLDGGSVLATYSYDGPPNPGEEREDTGRYLATVYANNHPTMHLDHPGCGSDDGVIAGGVMFESHMGSMKDYSMAVGLCPEVTVYTGCCVYPQARWLASLWEENRRALLSMLLEVHKGVKGVVRDGHGDPVVGAMVTVNGTIRGVTNRGGYFHTLLTPGPHCIQVTAQGYQPQIHKVLVSSGGAAYSMLVEISETQGFLHSTRRTAVAAAVAVVIVVLIILVVWRLCSAKSSWLRNGVRWLRHRHDNLHLVSMESEKSPLRLEFDEETDSDYSG